MTAQTAANATLDRLERDLRAVWADQVQRHGSRLTVEGSKIAADIEPDGGYWLTWADGSRTYNQATTATEVTR